MSGGVDASDGSQPAVGDGERGLHTRPPVMKLHLVRGSFFFELTVAAAAAAAAGPVAMDAELWSKMPEDLMWEVVRFLPAVTLFQWRLVSRKWRRELTSARIRERIDDATGTLEQQQPQERVVACVSPPGSASGGISNSSASCGNVVEVDLSMVPSGFWSPTWGHGWYTVVAAGHGLVVISNDHEPVEPWKAGDANSYCVVNPVTRACVVLPGLPFPPDTWAVPTSTRVAIFSGASSTAWRSATYDVAAAGAAGDGDGAGWVTAHKPHPRGDIDRFWWWSAGGAVLGDETYCYTRPDRRVHVLAPGRRRRRPGPGGGGGGELSLVEVGALDAPSTALLRGSRGNTIKEMVVTTHRGAVYLVGHLGQTSVVCGVWRLAARPGRPAALTDSKWEEVARLGKRELERLTGVTLRPRLWMTDAYGVGDMVCLRLVQETRCGDHDGGAWLVAFHLAKRQWELLLPLPYGECAARAFELRADEVTPTPRRVPRDDGHACLAMRLCIDAILDAWRCFF